MASLVKTFVFKGLLRPPTKLGVPYQFLILEMMIGSLSFVLTQSLVGFLLCIPLHVGIYLIHEYDHQLIRVWAVAYIEVKITRNRSFWGGGDSYS